MTFSRLPFQVAYFLIRSVLFVQSSVCHVPYSVPQGSVLGPLLFIFYIADTATFPGKHGLSSHFYADDIQLYLS